MSERKKSERQTVAIIANDPALVEWEKENNEMFDEVQALKIEWEARKKLHWEKMEALLSERGLLPPDFDTNTWNTGIGTGAVFIEPKSDEIGQDFMNALKKALS